MKIGLMIFASLCVSFGVSAQIGEIPTDYWEKFEQNYEQYDAWWNVDDQTQNVKALTGLTPENGMKVAEGSISNNAYTITTDGDVFNVHYEKTSQWEKFGLSWMYWAYPAGCESDNWQLVNPITGEQWADGKDCHRTAKGYSIDFSEPTNRMISFKYQAVSSLIMNIRVDLWDIKGRKTTRSGSYKFSTERSTIYEPSIAKQWNEVCILFASDEDEGVEEELGDDIFEGFISNDAYTGPLADGSNSWFNGVQMPTSEAPESLKILLDSSRIIGVEIYINDEKAPSSMADENIYDLYIKDLTVGNATKNQAENFQNQEAISVVEGNALEIVDGVVYSEGRIEVLDILGKTVKAGKEELSITDLPAGIYFIKAAEGTARFIK